MHGERTVIHINVADFAVAVERLVDSRLRERPVIVAPQNTRAVVYDMSEEAYQNGVRKWMALGKAMKHCRDARVVAPHVNRYESAMNELLRCALPYSPLIETTDHDGHLFLDVTGTSKLFGPAPDIARRIRTEIRTRLGVNPGWAVASNKLLAKVAARMVKPAGEYIVPPGDEAHFLFPVPLYLIPGIEPHEIRLFSAFHLTRAGQVADWSLDQLQTAFFGRAADFYNAVRGIDFSPVMPVGQKPPKACLDHEFATDVNDPAVVEGALYRLVEQAGADLRRRCLTARRTGIVIGYSDGGRMVRQAACPATANDLFLFKTARVALHRAWTRRVRIRHLRLICDRLTFPPAQLVLFPDRKEAAVHSLTAAIDAIRNRFGSSAITVGRTLASPPL